MSNTKLREPMPHQIKALDFLSDKDHAALFMEMRLGKTLVAIRGLVQKGANHVLIVCPLSVVGSWQRELDLEGITHVHIRGAFPQRIEMVNTARSEGAWCIIGYESLRSTSELARIEWDGVVLDESTKIKGPKSKITKLCLGGFRNARHRLILSGLPAPESPMDYYSQMAFLRDRFMGCSNFWTWRGRHFRPDYNGWNWVPFPDTPTKIATHTAKDAFVLDRKSAGIGETKIHEQRTVAMTPKQREQFLLARDEFCREVDGGVEMTQLAVTRFIWMQRIAGGMSADGDEVLSDAEIGLCEHDQGPGIESVEELPGPNYLPQEDE